MLDPPRVPAIGTPSVAPFFRLVASAFGKPVCRLGLASRGGSGLTPEDVHHALGRGVDFLNWPGTEDALSRAVAELGPRRDGWSSAPSSRPAPPPTPRRSCGRCWRRSGPTTSTS